MIRAATADGGRYRPPMANVVFVAPYALAATTRFVGAVRRCPAPARRAGEQRPGRGVPDGVRRRSPATGALDDCLDADQLAGAVAALGEPPRLGRPAGRHPREPPGAARRGARAPRHRRHDGRRRRQLPRQGAHEGGVRAAGVPCARSRRVAESAGRGRRASPPRRLPVRRQAARRRRRPQHVPGRRRRAAREWLATSPPARAADAAGGVRARRGALLRQRRRSTASWCGTRSAATCRARSTCSSTRGSSGACCCRATSTTSTPTSSRSAARRHRARPAHGPVAHGVVPPARRLGRHLRGRGPAAGRAVHDADVVRPRRRPVRGVGPARRRRASSTRRRALRRRRRLPAGPGSGALDRRPHGLDQVSEATVALVVEVRLPARGRADRHVRGRRLRHRARPRHGGRRGGARRAGLDDPRGVA